ncbi:hypothetical protein PYW08_004518 [Mythimna loreyi]|uniref:Uncharacterized protein n=1 Tax=Mythimna loreyi TaxID=667449 RepID=A0ACC2QP38_9NEOP|nr:hypothetical protein PYW08_004518 [Mythimna loreyi]
MSFFYPDPAICRKERQCPNHPWEKIIKEAYAKTYKYGHNSATNPVYPPPKKGRVPSKNRVKFTVIGTRTAKEFIYCMNLVKGLHKYRWRYFDAPIITALTSVEWPKALNDLKIKFGGEAYCLQSQVAVILNDTFLGGEKELKELIESKYIYYLKLDYFKEGINLFANYLKQTDRPFAFFEIMIETKYIGMLVFILYSDLLPRTCENFLRLCQERKGGYSGTPVHRIVKDGWIQCGGYGLKKTDLDCENFIVPHDRRGVLGMANDGRHVDCSTQFFVTLQPQDWMACKYVAFGQLVSGDEVLKEIEKVPVWYESPKKNIILAKAGNLNLRCQDLIINKGTNKYIEGHTENLINIGEIFYEALLEKVFLEIEFRALQRIQDEMQLESEITPEEAAKNLRTTARFMRKKEEIDKQLEKSEADRTGKTTPALTVEKSGENNDFDVEEYEYELEEYSYQQATAVASASLVVKPEKPYYIPLTDVPFPGEVTSEYDLKRLLQGHYCHEVDIDQEPVKKKVGDKKKVEEKIMFRPEVLEAIRNTQAKSESSEESFASIDTFDERTIQRYIQDNADQVTFGGPIVKGIGKSGKQNLFELQKKPDALIVDETLRQYRMAEYDLKHGLEKKVDIKLPKASDAHKEIIRRQTGFVRPEDLARMRQFERQSEDISEDSAELDDYLPYTRQVSIQQPHSVSNIKKIEAQRKSDQIEGQRKSDQPEEQQIKDNLKILSSEDVLSDADASDDEVDKRPSRAKFILPEESERKSKLDSGHGVGFKSSGSLRGSRSGDIGGDRRVSVLARLLEEVEHGPGPTLKDYKPFSEQQRNKSVFLLTYSPEKYKNLKNLSDDSREMYLRRRHPINLDVTRQDEKPIDQILSLQHGKKVYRKISTDYVQTIDRIEKKEQTSLRSLEYAKRRPAMSVHDYQKKNKEYQDNLARKSKLSSDSLVNKNKIW